MHSGAHWIRAKNKNFDVEYRRISLRQCIRLAVLVVVTAMVATGAVVYVTYVIGGIRANQRSIHSEAFAIDLENASNTLDKAYRITYDLSKFKKEILHNEYFEYWERYHHDNDFTHVMRKVHILIYTRNFTGIIV